jgi:hypothetical protein
MNSWLFRSLVALYPKAWRERYSKEVGDLSAELLEAGETTRLHLALELARSALVERVRSLHRGRFIAVLSGSAALVVVLVATFLVTNGFGVGGAASPRMRPTGWGWARYRGAQVSFPPSFETVTSQPGGASEILFYAPVLTSGSVCVGPPGTDVCLLPLRQVPSPYASERPAILNGVPVYLGPNGAYYVPSLGVEITASGPLARRIVDTMTRNPQPGCIHPNPHRACIMGSGTVTSTIEVTTPALPPK